MGKSALLGLLAATNAFGLGFVPLDLELERRLEGARGYNAASPDGQRRGRPTDLGGFMDRQSGPFLDSCAEMSVDGEDLRRWSGEGTGGKTLAADTRAARGSILPIAKSTEGSGVATATIERDMIFVTSLSKLGEHRIEFPAASMGASSEGLDQEAVGHLALLRRQTDEYARYIDELVAQIRQEAGKRG